MLHSISNALSSQCRPWEEESQLPDAPNPVTTTKSPRNYGARHDNPDAESSSAESDEDPCEEEEPVAPKKRASILAQYVPVKWWIEDERAEMDDGDIENQLFEEARQLMQLSWLKKLPGHKGLSTDLHLWKRSYDSRGNNIHHLSLSYEASVWLQVHHPRWVRKGKLDSGALRAPWHEQSCDG